jgi:O-succinylbenzoic acid--CoA ligase
LIGGGQLPPELTLRAKNWHVDRTYGMTETAAVIASGPAERDWMEVLSGIEISAGQSGRLSVRGEQVSVGYVGGPDRSPRDWLETSDIGEVHDGQVRVLGRADRAIISGGEKVDPVEVETLLLDHPGVSDAVVFGLADEEWGEIVALAYTGTASPGDVANWVADRLGQFARPRRIQKLASIPRSELGKVDVVSIFGGEPAKERGG